MIKFLMKFLKITVVFLLSVLIGLLFVQKKHLLILPQPQSLYGKYLAASHALSQLEFAEAANLFHNVLTAQPDNKTLCSETYMAYLMNGSITQAVDLADKCKVAPENNIDILPAVDAITQDNFIEAAKLLKQVRSDNKLSLLMKNLLNIWLEFYGQNYTKAAELFDELEVGATLYNLIKLEQALFAYFANNTELANQSFGELAADPQSEYITRIIGEFYEMQGELEKAREVYMRVLSQNPYDSIILNRLERLKKNQIYTQLSIQNPKEAIAWLMTELGVMISWHNPAQAIEYIQIALHLAPDLDYANIAMGDFYNRNEKPNYAISYYSKVPKDSEYYFDIQANIIAILYKQGDFKKAKKLLHRIINQEDLYNYNLLLIMHEIVEKEQDYLWAIRVYDNLISHIEKVEPYHWPLFYMRASNYYMADDMVSAEQDYQTAYKLNPENCSILNDLGYNLILQRKNIEQAFEMITQALGKCPNSPAILDSMGWALFMQQKPEEAKQYIEKAIGLSPDSTEISEHLGDIKWSLEQKIQAKFEWQHALDSSRDPKERKRLEEKLARDD
jgi:tetratricopeptide (TPR) repeat protein